jgi:signal transduction histidine kinase
MPAWMRMERTWFLNMSIPLHDDSGKTIRWFGSATDIDDLKRTEKEILDLNADLENRVSQRTAELEAFAFSVSHDLRAPLRAIKGFSQILLDQHSQLLDEDGRKLLSAVKAYHRIPIEFIGLPASRQELTFRINMYELFLL